MESPDHPQDVMCSHGSNITGEFPCTSSSATATLKRKRTKRHRAHYPPPPHTAASSSTSSVDLSEEEDMAHCLILLARGRALDSPSRARVTSRRFTVTATAAGGKAGLYVYECKTCSKCFPSFQALGGHRTSHKKPKTPVATASKENKQYLIDQQSVENIANNVDTSTSNNISNDRQLRIHECSICGAEFSSGQALGGHMRRHRPAWAPLPERNVPSLDLNLPAPTDDHTVSERPPQPPQPTTFPFADKLPMVFSLMSTLVDCHI